MKIIKTILPYIIILVVVILLRTFVITPVSVDGISMYPTLHDNDVLLLNKIGRVERLSIVVIDQDGEQLIKRIIAIPGETISIIDNAIIINDMMMTNDLGHGEMPDFEATTLGDDEYFVMGDNRADSKDSRWFGPVRKDKIKGTANLVIFPFKNMGVIK